MPDHSWILVAILLLLPSLVVGFLRFVLGRTSSASSGWGGVLFSLMALDAALWIIVDKVS